MVGVEKTEKNTERTIQRGRSGGNRGLWSCVMRAEACRYDKAIVNWKVFIGFCFETPLMSWRKFQWKCFHLYLGGGVWWRWLAGDKWRANWKVSVDAAVDGRRWGGGHKKRIQATWEKISSWERMGVNMIRWWRKERKKCKIGKENTWWNDLPRNSLLCGLDDELVCSAMGFNMVCDSWYRHIFPWMTVKLRNLLSGGISFNRENSVSHCTLGNS